MSETTEYTIRSCEPGGVRHFLYFDEWETAVGNAVGPTLANASFPTIPSNLVKSPDIDSEPGTNDPLGYQLSFPDSATGLGFDFVLLNRSAANIPENSVQKWGLVFADTELPDHDFPGHGWISIGDVDGVGSGNEYRSQMENDDFVIELLGEASVYAIGFDVGDNDKRSGESITVEGGGFSYTFADPAQIPGEGFVGFLAPFPIERIIFDEDAGGDDIALRDLVFGVEASGN